MKKVNLSKFSIVAVVFFIFVSIAFIGFGMPNNQRIVYAQETEELQIKNDNTIISTELWVALYNVYFDTYNQKPAGDVLTLDMFKNFPINILNLSTNKTGSSYNIQSIAGLGSFDLSAFETINLSGNKINSVGDEFTNIAGIKKLDLSSNKLYTFSYDMLSNACYSNNLTNLDLSNNALSECNLRDIYSANINLQNNKLTTESLVLPTSQNCNVNVNNNYILNVEQIQTNVIYGFQGAKQNDKFENTAVLEFSEHLNLEVVAVEIYENNQLYNTLSGNQSITLPVGNYTLKFLNQLGTSVFDDVSFKVILPKVTAKLFVGEKEIPFSSTITEDTIVKFYGEDGAEIFCSTNLDSTDVKTAEYKLDKNGTIVLNVYQSKDGYYSDVQSFYFSVKKPVLKNWIIAIVGIVVLVVFYYVYSKVAKRMIYVSDKNTTKGKLD